MKKTIFDSSKISDAKRLARGEHWLAVRSFLRRRDRVHHAQWKIMTLAGHSPAEEIQCIKELMPKALIIAIDTDATCCKLALEAGADIAERVDVYNWSNVRNNTRQDILPKAIRRHGAMDAINLDFCGSITREMELAVRRYAYACRNGVLLLTFSYGRDVIELYTPGPYRGIPDPLGGRVEILDRCSPPQQNLTSVIAYRGNEMPMCALMWTDYEGGREDRLEIAASRPKPSFIQIGDHDLASASVYPDAAKLYATPAERIVAFRRKFSALKAVDTRRYQTETSEFEDTAHRAVQMISTNENTRIGYWRDAQVWFAFCAEQTFDLARPPRNAVEAFIEWMRQRGESSNTRVRRICALNSIYERLRHPIDGDTTLTVRRNPFSSESLSKHEQIIVKRPASMADVGIVRQVLETCGPDGIGMRDAAIIRIFWQTGLQRVALLSMTFESIHRGHDGSFVVRVVGQYAKQQHVSIHGKAAIALNAWLMILAEKGISAGPIWLGKYGPMDGRNLNHAFERRLKIFGAPKGALSPQMFRARVQLKARRALEAVREAEIEECTLDEALDYERRRTP